jgi:hypothetical protein
VARNYTALTLNLATGGALTQYDVIAVSAMEAVGVAPAVDLHNQIPGAPPASSRHKAGDLFAEMTCFPGSCNANFLIMVHLDSGHQVLLLMSGARKVSLEWGMCRESSGALRVCQSQLRLLVLTNSEEQERCGLGDSRQLSNGK